MERAPNHAIQIWTEGDMIHLMIPPPEGAERPHFLQIPRSKCSVECSDFGQPLARQRGWLILLDLLRERERAEHKRSLGTKADPVQYDVEKMLVAMQSPEAKQRVSSAKVDRLVKSVDKLKPVMELLEELGLK